MRPDAFVPEGFQGTVRLFPLPNVVLFPQAVLPLHIFEPRYQQMTEDALAGDRLIALCLLKPGWESNYQGNPALYPVACLGKVLTEQRLEDGRFNILLRGLCRVRLVDEIPTPKLYRTACVRVLHVATIPGADEAADLRGKLIEAGMTWMDALGLDPEQSARVMESGLPIGALADVLAFALPLPVERKQQLLEELDARRRTEALLHYLETSRPARNAGQHGEDFPPAFSTN